MNFGIGKLKAHPSLAQSSECLILVSRSGDILDQSPSATKLAQAYSQMNAAFMELVERCVASCLPAQERIPVPGIANFWVVANTVDQGCLITALDTTLSDRMTDALVKSRGMLKSLLDASVDISFQVDKRGIFTFLSPVEALGKKLEPWIGRRAQDLFWPGGPSPVRSPLSVKKPTNFAAVPVGFVSGRKCWFSFIVEPVLADDGSYTGARGSCRDVTEQVLADKKTKRDNLRLGLQQRITRQLNVSESSEEILDNASAELMDVLRADMVWSLVKYEEGLIPASICGDATVVPDINGIWRELALSSDPVLEIDDEGRKHLAVRLEQSVGSVGMVLVSRDTSVVPWADYEKSLLEDVMGALASAFGKAELINRLRRLSTQDELTGLWNRRAFVESVERRLRQQCRSGQSGCMLFIDLDHFKSINDTLGHAAGDAALELVADTLKSIVRESDYAGRLGGDEFVVWLENISANDAAMKARTLLEAMTEVKTAIGAEDMPLGASIGICASEPGTDLKFGDLSERADAALYQVKKTGRNNIAFAEPSESKPERVAS